MGLGLDMGYDLGMVVGRLSFKLLRDAQGPAKRWSPGLVNFVAAFVYHFCMASPAAFTQPGKHLLAEPCMSITLSQQHNLHKTLEVITLRPKIGLRDV